MAISELFHPLYREIADEFGEETAIKLYHSFRGMQISFPMGLYDTVKVKQRIREEYDGTNIKTLAVKYGYSEKSIRRFLKDYGKV